MRESVATAKHIVIKLGTRIVIKDDGTLAEDRLSHLVEQCAAMAKAGKQLILVSSGAVGLGREALKLTHPKLSTTEKQACAAVGQNLMMNAYQARFSRYGFQTAQLLLTSQNFMHRQSYLNLRETLTKLLELNVIPIINENDTVSTAELEEDRTQSFGDNDKLSALVASKLDADLLIILTNVDGIYSENPTLNPNALKMSEIEGFEQLHNIQAEGISSGGRGGMATKLEAAKIAAISGIHTVIASGFEPNMIQTILSGESSAGTLIWAKQSLSGRKRWLGLASGYQGVIVVNDGAKQALVERQASLLPSGIVNVEGEFQAKQVVSLQDEHGTEFGRGIVYFSASETQQIQGKHSHAIEKLLGVKEYDVVIHRDNLVIFEEYTK